MCIGFDVGTYNLVSCRRNVEGKIVYKGEVNSFIEIPLENDFVFKMMRDIKIDEGTPQERRIPLIERKDIKIAYALGESSVDIAYTLNGVELKRPMLHGCLNPQEKQAQQMLNVMVHGLLGKVEPGELLYYSSPANAINEETDADFHSLTLESMFKAYQDESGNHVKPFPINEGLALIYAELKDRNFTGLGISFGAGMVNICYSIFGNPVFKFALVNSGDWIDKMAAKATGEPTTFINREKTKIDFNEESTSLVQRAIKTQYEIMLKKTAVGIKNGLEQTTKIRTQNPVDIVIAGGTSLPEGFDRLFADTLQNVGLPVKVGSIIKPTLPLYSVARGCLIAAEAAASN